MNSFEPFNRGVELSMAQRDEEALVAFDEALRADPEHLGALAGKGICLARLGRIDLALETFIAASLRDPDDPNLHLQAGLCFLQLGEVAQARGCVELAIGKVGFERSRENWAVELYNVGGWYMKGAAGWRARGSETQERVGYQLAEACFGLALECLPTFPQAAHGLSVACAAQGRREDASRFADLAERLSSASGGPQ
ncbi:MAG: tetratricopeptide repeat protein [Myxococcales bacterium]|nr:tetratricopeptide repeat protein [Myxococcales bacterium]